VAEQIGSILPETETQSKLEHQFLISAKAELDENIQDEGLWLQCFTDARGNSEIAKAFYLRRRGLAQKKYAEEEERQAEIKRLKKEKEIADQLQHSEWGVYWGVFLVCLLVLALAFSSS
jgi:t-SNARE complex subunit (syntaxin)